MDQGPNRSTRSDKVDPAALLIAVLAAAMGPTLQSGRWGPINTILATVIFVIAFAYSLWGVHEISFKESIATFASLGLVLSVAVAWPLQEILVKRVHRNANDDKLGEFTLLYAFGVAAVIVGVWFVMRRHRSSSGSDEAGDATAARRRPVTRVEGASPGTRPRRRRRPAWTWGLTYMAAIPAFAVLYWSMPTGSFTSSTIRREPAMKRDAARLIAVLDQRIEEQSSTKLKVGGTEFTVVPNSVSVTRLALVEGRSLRATVRFTVTSEDGRVQQGVGSDLEIPLLARTIISPPGREPYAMATLLLEDAELERAGQMIPTVSHLLGRSDDIGTLNLPMSEWNKLVQFNNAGEGEVRSASDRFARMLYFSAITATTVGFGDITPTSTHARLAVAGQAIVGIGAAGLFLNAIASRRRQSESQSQLPTEAASV